MKLKLGDSLQIPIEIAGQAVALVGIRGSGKTNTAGVIAEELLDRGQPIVVLDPTDAWWGLRSDYPVFIFGGPHGDLTLNETDGKTLAEFVVQEKVPIILSLRHLRKGAQRRLVMEFCEELYHLKGRPEYREPLTVFIDEAPQFVPQRVMGEMARLVGAVQDMILLGRNVGFGVVLISQRFATLNADVRTQADTVIVHRLPSPLDRKALTEWIEENATLAEQKDVLSSLAKLGTGEAWIWSPFFDLFKRAQIRPRKTFDSSAAPKRGAPARAPKDLTKVDLEKLKGKLAATIEKAKADDPRELRKQIAELKKQLSSSPAKSAHGTTATISKPVLTDADRALLKTLGEEFREFSDTIAAKADAMLTGLAERAKAEIDKTAGAWFENVEKRRALFLDRLEKTRVQTVLGKLASVPQPAGRRDELTSRAPSAPAPARRADLGSRVRPSPHVHVNDDRSIVPAQQRILNGLAFLHGIGVTPADKTQLALIVGVSPTSGGYFNNLGALRSAGYIEYPTGGTVALTAAGAAIASTDGVPTTTSELHEAIRAKLPPAKWKILDALIAVYPKAMTKDALAERIEVSPTSGGYFNNLGSLRSLGLIEYPRPSEVAALPVLFLEER